MSRSLLTNRDDSSTAGMSLVPGGGNVGRGAGGSWWILLVCDDASDGANLVEREAGGPRGVRKDDLGNGQTMERTSGPLKDQGVAM